MQIDTKAVAEARGYKNAGSVANRITKIKKRYNLPIVSSLTGSRKVDPNAATEAKAVVAPNKNKVSRARTTRGRAVPKKVVKGTTPGSEDSSENAGEVHGLIWPGASSKSVASLATLHNDPSSGDEGGKGFTRKSPEEFYDENFGGSGDGAEDEESGYDMEQAEILIVKDENPDEV